MGLKMILGRGMAAGLAALGLLVLPSCVSPEQLAAQDDAQCVAMGIPTGSPDYGRCRLALTEQRAVAQQAAAARLQAASAAMQAAGGGQAARPSQTGGTACFKRSEATSGMNKICYYDCLGSTVAHNIGVAELCPLTINR